MNGAIQIHTKITRIVCEGCGGPALVAASVKLDADGEVLEALLSPLAHLAPCGRTCPSGSLEGRGTPERHGPGCPCEARI